MDPSEEQALREREIAEEVEEEREWYQSELAEREAAYARQLAEWRELRKTRVSEREERVNLANVMFE